MALPSQSKIVKGSFVQAIINFGVNGVINYFVIQRTDVHLVTSDSITAGNDTVVGHAVTTAVILAVVFTLLGFKGHRRHLPQVGWPRVCGMAVQNAIYAFGLIVIAGVLWQRIFPNVTVGSLGASTIAGLIAGAVSGITNYSTLTRLSERFR